MSSRGHTGFAARIAMLAIAALLSIGAAPDWNTTIAKTGGGHRLGNPDAAIKLIAFESYTCPHCAHFEKEADGPLRVGYVHNGKLSLEVRHVIRDPVDLTATVLANCGAPAKFFAIHRAIMFGQDKWAPLMVKASKAQTDRWYNGDQAARRRAMAGDLGFYALVATQGLTRVAADKCLGDNALADRLAKQTKADDAKWTIAGTPSFAINGAMLLATHSWSSLQLQLDARL